MPSSVALARRTRQWYRAQQRAIRDRGRLPWGMVLDASGTLLDEQVRE